MTNNQQNQQQQIHKSFNKKSSLRVQRDDTLSAFSQHSSIFEAFEVAPLQTIAHDVDEKKPATAADTRLFLNDFGVHHAYVKRGVVRKKVGFPETASAPVIVRSKQHQHQRESGIVDIAAEVENIILLHQQEVKKTSALLQVHHRQLQVRLAISLHFSEAAASINKTH